MKSDIDFQEQRHYYYYIITDEYLKLARIIVFNNC